MPLNSSEQFGRLLPFHLLVWILLSVTYLYILFYFLTKPSCTLRVGRFAAWWCFYKEKKTGKIKKEKQNGKTALSSALSLALTPHALTPAHGAHHGRCFSFAAPPRHPDKLHSPRSPAPRLPAAPPPAAGGTHRHRAAAAGVQGDDRARRRVAGGGGGGGRDDPVPRAGRGPGGAARLQARRVHDVPGAAGLRGGGPERRHAQRRRRRAGVRAAVRSVPALRLHHPRHPRGRAAQGPARHRRRLTPRR